MDISKYNLKKNPFNLTPYLPNQDIRWAGFPELKKKLTERIKRSVAMKNSSIVLNWGEYGSGKTHALRYFSSSKVTDKITNEQEAQELLCFDITLANDKDPVAAVFTQIIDKLNVKEIRDKIENNYESTIEFLDNIINNQFVKSVVKAILNRDDSISENLIKKYLYNSVNAKELSSLNEYGILRNIKNADDYTSILSALFMALTLNKKTFSCLVLWIDEFENIISLNSSNVGKVNNFLRNLIDECPNNLLIFINLTQSSLIELNDLSEYLNDSVKSRIKERIEFKFPNQAEFKSYLKELLKLYSIDKKRINKNKFHPFNEDLIDQLLNDSGDITVRNFNEYLSLLLELAIMDKSDINLDLYTNYKEELIGWKN